MPQDNETAVYDLVKISPDGQHIVDLNCKGEYSMANFWYSIIVDGKAIEGREVVDSCIWSSDSRYFAVTEIPEGEYPQDGRFNVLLFDFERKRFSLITHPEDKGIRPVRFDGNNLICQTWRDSAEWSFAITTLQGWQPL